MRIEIDQDLAKLLDAIKRDEAVIYGRGHVETVRFLANYYNTHKSIEELRDILVIAFRDFLIDVDVKIEDAIERGIVKAARHVIMRLLKPTDENQPDVRSQRAEQDPGEGR